MPFLLLAAFCIKVSSPGPVLYTQVRLGRDGRHYTLFKFRTMAVDSEKNGACWCLPGDKRVTWLGRFLRRTHIDELPQLWNVLRREMSLIGPRPERPEFVRTLEGALPHYRQRLALRPGLTGLAQVQQAADTDLESVRTKLADDLWYVKYRSFGLDVRILLATALLLCGTSFRLLRWLFRFPTRAMVEAAYTAREAAPVRHDLQGKALVVPGM
jgi:lipopolysaccharide/colanic/teichoic acid biosynthesis glycosyltransferase